jgi:hypothetical protein
MQPLKGYIYVNKVVAIDLVRIDYVVVVIGILTVVKGTSFLRAGLR